MYANELLASHSATLRSAEPPTPAHKEPIGATASP